MKLHEEYLVRHGLKIPVINHCVNGSFFLRNLGKLSCPYSFLKISWMENYRGLGNYIVSHLCPIRNGFYEGGKIFENISYSSMYWDQYEDYIFNWVNEFAGQSVAVSEENCLLSAWEMFVYIFDSWFKNQSQEIKSILFDTLNEENSPAFRINSYKEICNYMSLYTPHILKVWREEILMWTVCYSEWLFKLFEEKCSSE